MKKKLFGILGLEAVLCVAYVLLGVALPDLFGAVVTFPFKQIGMGLRALSLSGGVGNGAAVVLYAVLCLIPVGALLRKKARHWEDILLVLLSAVLFPVMYLMVNPQLLSSWLGGIYGMVGSELLGLVTYSILVGYALMTMMRKSFAAEQPRLMDYLKWLMWIYCAVLVFQVFGSGLDALITNLGAFRQANTGALSGLGLTYVFLILQYLVNSLPDLLLCGILLRACGVLELLKAEAYTDALIFAADSLSRRCGWMLMAVVLSNVCFNLVQLLFIRELRNVSTVVRMPLDILVLVVGLLLAARFIRSHKELRDENEQFI